MKSQQLRKLAPELDSLRLGSGWKIDELSKPQIIVESSYGHSHPGSAHLDKLVDEAGIGIKEKGGRAANYFVTDCLLYTSYRHRTKTPDRTHQNQKGMSTNPCNYKMLDLMDLSV